VGRTFLAERMLFPKIACQRSFENCGGMPLDFVPYGRSS